MKKNVRLKITDKVTLLYSDGGTAIFKVGCRFTNGEEIKGIITAGMVVQLLSVAPEEFPSHSNLSPFLIATIYGVPYIEEFKEYETEIEVDEDEVAPADNEVAQ